ncbi:unnamed protein product, partial [Mesorhabditis spiculigera]
MKAIIVRTSSIYEASGMACKALACCSTIDNLFETLDFDGGTAEILLQYVFDGRSAIALTISSAFGKVEEAECNSSGSCAHNRKVNDYTINLQSRSVPHEGGKSPLTAMKTFLRTLVSRTSTVYDS